MLRKGFDQARKAYDMLSEYLVFPESGGEWRYYRCFGMGDSKAGEGQLEERLCPRCRPFFLCNGRLLMGALEEIRYLQMYTYQQYLQTTHSTTHCRKQREVPEAEQTLSPQFVSHVSRLAFLFHLEFWSQVRMFLWAKLIQLSYGTYPLCRICEKPSPIILFA